MTATLRKYKATFILDTRGYEQPVDTLVDKLKAVFSSLGAEVTSATNMGRKDFIRVTSKRHTGDHYLQLNFAGPVDFIPRLREALRLEKNFKRFLIETAD